METVLRRSEESLAEAQRIAHIGSWEWNIQTGRRAWSDETWHIFGMTPGSREPTFELFCNLVSPEDRDRVLHDMQTALSGGDQFKTEYRLIRPDGQSRYVESQAKVFRDDQGVPIRFVGTNIDVTERKLVELELRRHRVELEELVRSRTLELVEQQARLIDALTLNEQILGTSRLGIAACRANGQCVRANGALANIMGSTETELIGLNFRELRFWQTSGLLKTADQVLSTGVTEEREMEYKTRYGRVLWLHFEMSRFFGSGEPHLLILVRDVTESKATEAESRLVASVFQHTMEGMAITDSNSVILSVNPAFEEITGYSAEESIGQKVSLLKSDHHDIDFYRKMWGSLTTSGFWQGEIWNRRKGGEAYLEWLTINAVAGPDGSAVRYVSLFHDITDARRKEEHIRHLAFHDALTGLPNRALFQDRLEHAVERALREGSHLAIAFLDLNGFKQINDSLGHDVGDILLQEVAKRIRSRLRAMDTVARLGGDEFVILMEDVTETRHCSSLADEILNEIARPMTIHEREIQVKAALGIALFPEDGCHAHELMKKADIAMYTAKAAKDNMCRFFNTGGGDE